MAPRVGNVGKQIEENEQQRSHGGFVGKKDENKTNERNLRISSRFVQPCEEASVGFIPCVTCFGMTAFTLHGSSVSHCSSGYRVPSRN